MIPAYGTGRHEDYLSRLDEMRELRDDQEETDCGCGLGAARCRAAEEGEEY